MEVEGILSTLGTGVALGILLSAAILIYAAIAAIARIARALRRSRQDSEVYRALIEDGVNEQDALGAVIDTRDKEV